MKYKQVHGPKYPCKSCKYNGVRISLKDKFKMDDYCIWYNTFITPCGILYQCQKYKRKGFLRHIVVVI